MPLPLFPLKRRIPIYRAAFKAMRSYGMHKAQDYRAKYEPLYAHEDCEVKKRWTRLGGHTIDMIGKEYKLIAAHLSKVIRTGNFSRGEQVAVTGNTGQESTGPHLHLETYYNITGDILDPEKVAWDEERNNDMLIKKEGSTEISYLSSKKVRHPMSERAWVEYFDSAEPDVEATLAQYNAYPVGTPIFFNRNFGSLADDLSEEQIWNAEKAEV